MEDANINKDLPENAMEDKDLYFSVSPSKLSRLYIATLGIYGIYWFYKNWKIQKELKGMDVMPIPRSIFAVFYTHSLFNCISESIREKGVSSTFNPKLMATIFVVLLVVGNLGSKIGEMPDAPNYLQASFFVSLLLSVYPLQEAQDAVNLINNDPFGFRNSKYSWHNVLLIIAGVLFWFLALLGTFVNMVGENTI